jgi:hypothetical protein
MRRNSLDQAEDLDAPEDVLTKSVDTFFLTGDLNLFLKIFIFLIIKEKQRHTQSIFGWVATAKQFSAVKRNT